MGKFGIFRTPEDRALELMVGEHKNAAETSRIIAAEEGVKISPESLRRIKKQAFDTLVTEKREETTAEFLLDSVNKVIIKFEDIYDKFEGIYDKFEQEDRPHDQAVILGQLKDMLMIALKRLGELKSPIEKIQARNINIINASDVMIAIKQQQENWFEEMDPALDEGKLVFNKPKAEVVDAYHKWIFKRGKPDRAIEA